MWFFIIYKIIAEILDLHQYGANAFRNIDYASYALIGLFYLFDLFSIFWFSEKKYIQSNFDGEAMNEYFSNILRQNPSIYVRIKCYHIKTTRDHRTGEEHHSKAVTYTGSKQFFFKSWRDISNRLQIPRPGSKTLRIKVEKEFTFADDVSRRTFNQFKESYIRENQSRDTHIEHSVKLEIPGFKERVMGSDRKPPCWMSLPCFFLAHLLLLGWPYRWLLKSRTDKTEFKVKKEISISEDGANLSVPTYSTAMIESPFPYKKDLGGYGFGFKMPPLSKIIVNVNETQF